MNNLLTIIEALSDNDQIHDNHFPKKWRIQIIIKESIGRYVTVYL